MNPILLADGYKEGHHLQYPNKTELVYDNFTPRSSRTENKSVIVFGPQIFIKKYLIQKFNEDFFNKDKDVVVGEFYNEISAYLNDPKFDVSHVAALHDLGYLPIKIKALPEGSRAPLQVPLLTIVNTKPEFFWLPNYLETIMSCICWGPITSATTAFELRKTLDSYARRTVGNTDFVQWQAHDFSFRGMFGLEAALMSGAAHLTSFTGTDTIPAISFLKKYYNAEGLIGGSIPATEHSVMCAGGDATELETFVRLLTEVYPEGPVSIVSDTWDYFGVLTKILPQIKDIIMKRNGKLVIRPDSGDQFHVICGHKLVPIEYFDDVSLAEANALGATAIKLDNGEYRQIVLGNDGEHFELGGKLEEYEIKGTIEVLWDLFGGTTTEMGYRLLDSHIGCILGDGVTPALMKRILARLEEKKFASYNMVFGIGSYTYQCVTRDTYGMAMKATFCKINGVEKEIFKDPKTTNKAFTKKSAKGLLQVKRDINGNYVLRDQVNWADEENSELTTVFEDGKLIKETTLAEIRDRINKIASME